MKTKICFAGFNNEELAALQLATESMNAVWQTVFVSDAKAALSALGGEPFDALVANMSSSGSSNTESLREAGERHPKTLQFMVGEVADQAQIINCVGGVHQFIARPFEPKDLISTVQRGLSLDAWLSSEQLRKLAPQLRRLPSLPSTYFELLKKVETSNVNIHSVGEVISRDPAVTVRLLQMVNSAAFALAQKITDPVDAVSILGLETVKSLVLCLQVFSQADEAKQAGVSLEELWEHSSTVGDIARKITLNETRDNQLANDAFTAGLLHDVGRIVLASNMPNEYAVVVAAARRSSHPLHEEESAQLGVTHAQVGAYLLGLWGMPATLVEAAAAHHSPSQTAAREFSILTAVHAANVLAHASARKSNDLPLPDFDHAHFEAIGMEGKPEAWQRLISGEPTEPVTAHNSKPQPDEPLVAPLPAANRDALTYLVPVAVVIVVVIGLLAWSKLSKSRSPLHVNARAHPPSVTAEKQTRSFSNADTSNTPTIATERVKEKAGDHESKSKPVEPTTVQPTESNFETAATPSTTQGFESVKVQGVFFRATNPLVILNGKTISIGDRVNGVEVTAIDQSSVTLSFEGESKTFKVK